jgi:hypothetical protein
VLTLEQIEAMSPREAWHELQNYAAVLPLLIPMGAVFEKNRKELAGQALRIRAICKRE